MSRFATKGSNIHRLGMNNALNGLLFILGAIVNALSYGTLEPIAVVGVLYLIAISILRLTPLGGAAEHRMFNTVFCTCFLMAGISAVFANQFNDFRQLTSDAGGFYEMAASRAQGLSLGEIERIHEGALIIVVWRGIYDLFSSFGFEKSRYIGISANVIAVSLSGVLGIKMVRLLFGNDWYRFQRLTLLVASCGLFWLFAAVHLRDAVVLLGITSLALAWIYFLVKPDIGWRLFLVSGLNLLAFLLFGFMRSEFLFVPIAMTLAAVSALYLGRINTNSQPIAFAVLIIAAVVAFFFFQSFKTDIQSVLVDGRLGYGGLAEQQHDTGSLGMSLIVKQPLPIRLVLGSVYLCVLPIPVWNGFQQESAYHFFKSANALLFYGLLPLLAIAVYELYRNDRLRIPQLLFPLFLSLGFTASIAISSLESRHFAAFLMPMFVLGTLPDLRDSRIHENYKRALTIMLAGVVLVHLIWVVLKFR